jgi:hypothetical protein
MSSATTDYRDVGRYVARIIADERTLNHKVFAYGDLITQKGAAELLEKLSGESLLSSAIHVCIETGLKLSIILLITIFRSMKRRS